MIINEHTVIVLTNDAVDCFLHMYYVAFLFVTLHLSMLVTNRNNHGINEHISFFWPVCLLELSSSVNHSSTVHVVS